MINKNFLTKRISSITNCVTKKVVCEVGADHGYITYQLFLENKVKFAYLTDISAKSLQKSKTLFEQSKFRQKVAFGVGNGLEAISQIDKSLLSKRPIEQIVIAGMGGKEIIQILAKNKIYTHFVLQPQKNVVDLRKFLIQNNYQIVKDKMVKDGKIFYDILVVKKVDKTCKLSQNQILFGKTNLKTMHQDFVNYLEYKKQVIENILQKKNIKEQQKLLDKILKLLQNK